MEQPRKNIKQLSVNKFQIEYNNILMEEYS